MDIAQQMYEALKAWQFMEHAHANCLECDGIVLPETCGACFPLADDARIKMKEAIKRAQEEGGYDHGEIV